jgi:mannan endo-1,4-beta-mannosidase
MPNDKLHLNSLASDACITRRNAEATAHLPVAGSSPKPRSRRRLATRSTRAAFGEGLLALSVVALSGFGVSCGTGASRDSGADAQAQNAVELPGKIADRVRFFPRSGYAYRMDGGRFQGSNASESDAYVDLATISGTPDDGVWTEMSLPATNAYRYLRYLSPDDDFGNIAELEFYSGDAVLTGVKFGTPGSWQNSSNTFDKAFDGNTSTFFDAPSGSGDYVGIDTGATCPEVTLEAESMTVSTPANGSLPTAGGETLLQNGSLSGTAEFAGGATTISVVASGSVGAGVWSHMTVSVDGTVIGSATVNSGTPTPYTFQYDATAGKKQIKVAFDNDYYANGEDRNLFVDKVVIGCPSACTPTSYDAGNMIANVGAEISGGWNLWGNGTLSTTHDFQVPGKTPITVVAEGQEGGGAWPHMNVKVDGVVVGSATVSSTQWTKYTFDYDVAAIGAKTIAVEFDNDYYANGQDRNLLVDEVTVGCPGSAGGGTPSGAGGASGTGGASSTGTGGASSTGTGGASSTGTGGARSGAGGATGAGGALATGGVSSTGGALSTGGATSSGGSSSSGGTSGGTGLGNGYSLSVHGRFLYDACGEKVVLRGVNHMAMYNDRAGNGIPEIAKTGANTVRIFWWAGNGVPITEAEQLISRSVQAGMAPILEMHDATGPGNWGKLGMILDYYTSPEAVALIKKYEKQLIINIANEAGPDWGQDYAGYEAGYHEAIQRLRAAGIRVPLMIDASGWGRDYNVLLQEGQTLVNDDPLHNVLLSWHSYDPLSTTDITKVLEQSVSLNLPFLVGEFANKTPPGCGAPINYQWLISEANRLQIGYIPWSWGADPAGSWVNSDCWEFDMTDTLAYSTLQRWGLEVAVTDPNSIQNTSKRPASFTNGGVCK